MLDPKKIETHIAQLDRQAQEQTIALGRTQGSIAALRGVLAELNAPEVEDMRNVRAHDPSELKVAGQE